MSAASREELELQKLRLEIAALGKSRWGGRDYFMAFIVAAATFLGVYYSHAFDQERARLQRETEELRSERARLSAERDAFRQQAAQLQANYDHVSKAIMDAAKEWGIPTPTPSPR